MDIINAAVRDLIPYKNNPRNNANAVDAVAASIKEFGFKVPIIIDKNRVIVAGHTRLLAAKKLGMEEVPCIIAEDLTEAQIKAFRLADNKLAELSEWDLNKLAIELDSIDLDMSQFGFYDSDRDVEVKEDNFEVILPEEPKSAIGDIYLLGEHRVMCGDSTSCNDVSMLLGSDLADMVCTDPPYNMNYEGAGNTNKSKRKGNKILNDHMPDEKFRRFLIAANRNICASLKDGGSFYIFYKELGNGVFIQALADAGLTFKQELIWVKNNLVLGGNKYQNIYEPCLYGCKGPSVKYWYAGRKERSVIESVEWMTEDELRSTVKELLGEAVTDIVRCDKNTVNDLHPTMKPVRLLSLFVKNSSKKGDMVFDCFGGSGSTLIACEQLERKCFMMEFDPRFVDVIINRWEAFTGKIAIKETRGT